MGPDLRNVITVTETRDDPGPRIVARHRAFPEAQAQGQTLREALEALQSVLERSEAWTTDTWHTVDLARAIFDVKSILWLLDCPDRAVISGGHHSKVFKEHDTVYYLTYCPDENAAPGANGGDDRPGSVGTPGVPTSNPTILVYSLGRRRGTRRLARIGQEPGPDRREWSRRDRRKGDRRNFSRIALVAEAPTTSGLIGEVLLERPDVPTGSVPDPISSCSR
jgi:hypothetical protein